jgi:hypothetical protein
MPDDPAALAAHAQRCRRLANECEDVTLRKDLLGFAEGYERRAKANRRALIGKAEQPKSGVSSR